MAEDGRSWVRQPVLTGGLAPETDVLQPRDSAMWLDCQNMILSNPTGYLSSVNTKRGCATTPPPTKNKSIGNTYTSVFTYLAPVFQQTIATFENTDWPTETWTFSGTGTASLVAAITEGDQCLSLANTAGQTATGTCDPLPTALNLSAPTYGILAVDTNWSSVTNFSSGYIRIGSDSTNYRQYDLSVPAGTGNIIMKFTFASPSSTTGTPVMTAIDYVQISVIATGGGAITVKFDNLRLASFASVSNTTLTLIANSGNIKNSFILDKIAGISSSDVSEIGDSIFLGGNLGDGGTESLSILKGGFTNTTAVLPTNFYFTQFPKTGAVNQNILYYVNGSDGYFSYDTNASAGSQHARISATAYKYICTHKNMVFVAAPTSNPNTVYPSDVNDPTTITAGNAVVIPDKSGSYVTGIYDMNDYLLIMRNTDFFKLYGSNPDSATTDFQLYGPYSKVGGIEQKSGCRVGSDLYFFSGDEIYKFSETDSVSVSGPLDSQLDQYNTKLCSLYYNPIRDCVVFNFVPATVVDPVVTYTDYYQLWYYIKGNAWGKTGAYNNAEAVKFFGISWGGSLYSKPLVFNGGLQFYQVDPTTPTDISMPWYLKTQWNDANQPHLVKDHDTFEVFARDIASVNTPALKLELFSDFDPDTVRQTFDTTNEVQTITPSAAPDAGTWTITYAGQTTASLAYNATAGQITTALDNLSNLVPGDIIATGTLATAVTLTCGGALAGLDVEEVTVAYSLTAASVAVTLAVATTTPGITYYPSNNCLSVLCTGVSGRSVAAKISGTCDDQKDEAVMISGYDYSWSEIEDA